MLFSRPYDQCGKPIVQRKRKIVGVMGGMGPSATVDFMAKVIDLTEADCDQNHVHMIVDNDPTVPNRQQAIHSQIDDVSERLTAMAKRLEDAGADFLVLVCNTAHVFLSDMRANVGIPFVSIIDETVSEIKKSCPQAKSVGVMATTGCLDTGIYQDAIAANGLSAVIPDAANQLKCMDLINAIKAGDESAAVGQAMEDVADVLKQAGAEVLIAGCTEIPLVFSGSNYSLPVFASTDILARRTVDIAAGVQS